jgi:hypothetical protein
MQGFPPRLPGSIEILSWYFMAKTSTLFVIHLLQCLHLQPNEREVLWRAADTQTLLNGTARHLIWNFNPV